MSSSKFALQQLSKHGWKEGSGLGKSEDGIKEAIKVKIKHDSHGVGHKKGDEFAFHWWDHVFNKAASNISVNSTQDGVELSKMKDSDRISTTTSKTFDNKAMLYGKFLKGATLSNGNYEETNEEDSEDEEKEHQEDTKPSRIQDLDDDVLLKACGGMTGHKAARHGHKLNGKLARIQEQEALLLAKYKSAKTVTKGRKNVPEQENPSVKYKETDDDIVQTDKTTDMKEERRKERKRNKSERKKRKREMDESECNIENETIDTEIVGVPTQQDCEESSESVVEDADTRKKRKAKKRKNKDKYEITVEDSVCDEELDRKKKKKDKKRKNKVLITEDVSSVTDYHKKRRKDELKTKSCDDNETSLSKHSDECEGQDSGAIKKKKNKKRKKEKS